MTKTRMRNDLKNLLFKRYGKLVLEAKEVENEVHEKAKSVLTTSSVADTWLIDDVVNHIIAESEPKKRHNCAKQHRAEIIHNMNNYLIKYWKQEKYDLSELGIIDQAEKMAA